MKTETCCEKLSKCPFFNDQMNGRPEAIQLYKDYYCKDRFSECARYLVSEGLGKDKVPKDLYPNDSVQARTILKEHSGSSK